MEHPYCAAYQSEDGNIAIAVSGGELICARVGGRELSFNELGDPLVWEQIARQVNKDYDHYEGLSDLQIATEAMAKLPCEECPWAKYCEDMNANIEQGAEFDLSEFLQNRLHPSLLDKPVHLMVDCGKTRDIIVPNIRLADSVHDEFCKAGYTLLPQECPVVNKKEIVIHYTSTTYEEWCNAN